MLKRLSRPIFFLLSGLLTASAASAQSLPIANAGPDQTVQCAPPAGKLVQLDGSQSSDPDGQPLTFTWTGAALAQPVNGATPTVLLPPGVNVLTLTVNDGVDGSATDTVTITVVADTTPPQLVLVADSDQLWPPNHKLQTYVAADLVASVSDDCTALTPEDVVFAEGTSDEPDLGIGDGNFPNDISFSQSCSEADVRAERSGTGDGRVYHLLLHVEDAAGNVAEEPFTVSVPHDRGRARGPGHGGAVDSGVDHTVTCESQSATCAPSSDPLCSEAGASQIGILSGPKGDALRWRATGFPAGSVSDQGAALCLYLDGNAAGGSLHPDRVFVGSRKGNGFLGVATRGADLTIPPLPVPDGSVLRAELHDGAGACVAADFSHPSVNDGTTYQAGTGQGTPH